MRAYEVLCTLPCSPSRFFFAQQFSCPDGKDRYHENISPLPGFRAAEFMTGSSNPICTKVSPNGDFAPGGLLVLAEGFNGEWLRSEGV
jgi:hypothetical protein